MTARSAWRTHTDWRSAIPTLVDATDLELVKLHKLDATVVFKVHNRPVYTVVVYGPASSARYVRQDFKQGILTLSGSRSGIKIRLDCLGRRIDTWLAWLLRPLRFLDIHIAREFGRVIVYMPVGTPIEAILGYGDAIIGSTHGRLTARLLGKGNLTAGIVGDAELRTYDSGKATVECVEGDVTIQQNGPGQINAQVVSGDRIQMPPDKQ